MSRLKVLQPASSQRISQAELRSFVAVQNSLRVVKQFYQRRSMELLEALHAGADIEDGTHIVEIQVSTRGNTRIEKLIVR